MLITTDDVPEEGRLQISRNPEGDARKPMNYARIGTIGGSRDQERRYKLPYQHFGGIDDHISRIPSKAAVAELTGLQTQA